MKVKAKKHLQNNTEENNHDIYSRYFLDKDTKILWKNVINWTSSILKLLVSKVFQNTKSVLTI